jgi:two-component SAPR family response regulator
VFEGVDRFDDRARHTGQCVNDLTHDAGPSPGLDGADGVAGRANGQVMPGAALDIRLLGGCSFSAPSQPEIRIASRKGRALIAYLAMAPRMQAGREQLAALLWHDRPEAQARQSLRQCLIALRKDLGPQSAALVTTAEVVALDSAAATVDALRLQELAAFGADQVPALEPGPFLHDFTVDSEPFMAWAAGERERIEPSRPGRRKCGSSV